MNRFSYIAGPLAFALLAVGLVDPTLAQGHALFADGDPNRPLTSYLGLGFKHMIGGWDHLLFIAGVVLLAGNWRTAAKLITLFVLGHSLTLLVATLAGWHFNATLVDVVIALSLVYVGLLGWKGPPDNLRLVGVAVFGFGLIHGLGLSTRLQDLGLPESGLVERILLFNVGVELGQLTALAVIVGLGALYVRRAKPSPGSERPVFAVLGGLGLLTAILLSLPDVEPADPPEQTASGICTKELTTRPSFSPKDEHPQPFFERDDEVPADDLNHVVNDGYVVVYYHPELADSDLDELESWVLAEQPSFVVGAPEPDQDQPIEAITAEEKLSCTELSIADLTEFRNEWFDKVRAEQAG